MASESQKIIVSGQYPIKIRKWKVKEGSRVSKGTVLALFEVQGDSLSGENLKLKATTNGIVGPIEVLEGTSVCAGATLTYLHPATVTSCKHATVMKDMCADCGADLRMELGVPGDRKESVTASVAMIHSIPELIVSEEQALEIGKSDEEYLLKKRKLVLLVDLDQTLIHTTNDNIPPNLKDVYHFQLLDGHHLKWYHTRFRPFTNQFLEHITSLYQLHICTFGVRMYAHTIARLLDPDGKYFSHRILSRDECFDPMSKTANLRALFPCGDAMVCIIDDREDVWNNSPNLVHVKPYRFFQGTADINAPPGFTKTEDDAIPVTHTAHSLPGMTQEDQSQQSKGERHEMETVDRVKSKEETETKQQECSEVDGVQEVSNGSGCQLTHSLEEFRQKQNVDQPKCDIEGSKEESSRCASDCDINTDENVSQDMERASESKGKISTQSESSSDKSGGSISSGIGSRKCKEKEEDSCFSSSSNTLEPDPREDIPKGMKMKWDDDDDYLLHLQEILTRIHTAFYKLYDQCAVAMEHPGKTKMPSLKNIIPYVKRKVLKGVNLVLSGVIPINVAVERSRAYIVARELGATVQREVVSEGSDSTTHLVAAKAGTAKVHTARRCQHIKVVCLEWLWACAERWEHVPEELFPLDDFTSGQQRHKRYATEDEVFHEQTPGAKHQRTECSAEPSCKSSVPTGEGDEAESPRTRFQDTINPLYSFSDEDLEFINKEVDEMMEEDESSSSEDDEDRDARFRTKVLSSPSEGSTSSEESLSGEMPRGWNKVKLAKSSSESVTKKNSDSEDVLPTEEDTENELDRYEKNMAAFADDSSESNDESIGSVDDEIANAVEKEFLS